MSLTLRSSILALPGVGTTLAKRFAMLHIRSVADLLWHLPFRYESIETAAHISTLPIDALSRIEVTIEVIAAKRSARRRLYLTEAIVTDGQNRMRVIWFNQPYLGKTLQSGDAVILSGKVTRDRMGIVMTNPSYERPKPSLQRDLSSLFPVYRTTQGLTQKQMRTIVHSALSLLGPFPDWLSEDIRTRVRVISLDEAVRSIHEPKTKQAETLAEERLKFDELFLLQLRGEQMRRALQKEHAPHIPFVEERIRAFVQNLPFTLTKSQRIAAWEIFQDMERELPMNRLLEGDVGSGKTVVAALALYAATLSNQQGVCLAPTDILAKQHFASLSELFSKDISLALFTRTTMVCSVPLTATGKTAQKKELLERFREGKIDIVVGTHALIQDAIQFAKLGLIVVDEQHRFGVEQRKILRDKGGINGMPHFLSMTATPIPRTLALTIYGDLDISLLTELPPGRKPIISKLVLPHERAKAYLFLRDEIKKGRQVFVVCPLIDQVKEEDGVVENTTSEKKSVMSHYARLSTEIFPDLHVGYVHGKMKTEEKDAVMKQFAEGVLDILVSTSVIEVGVNIPNASVMMIEGAEQFGLAQLHQFRGRVGRSDHQSYCLLFPDEASEKAKKRLHFFTSTTDGFRLAEFDLEDRGPGEVYGTTQSGLMDLRLATLQDKDIIKKAREVAREIDLTAHPTIAARLRAFEHQIHFE